MDDVQAIRRLKRGEIGALETLVLRYQRKAIRTASKVNNTTLTISCLMF